MGFFWSKRESHLNSRSKNCHRQFQLRATERIDPLSRLVQCYVALRAGLVLVRRSPRRPTTNLTQCPKSRRTCQAVAKEPQVLRASAATDSVRSSIPSPHRPSSWTLLRRRSSSSFNCFCTHPDSKMTSASSVLFTWPQVALGQAIRTLLGDGATALACSSMRNAKPWVMRSRGT